MQLNEASILLVDDEPALLEILGGWLKRMASRAFCAESGAQALQVLSGNKIDLIISDCRMPGMDGVTLLERVRANGLHTRSVIFLSGYSGIEAREVYDLGAEAVLEKPIERDDLLNSIRRSLTDRSELWQAPPHALTCPTLTGNFESLATAVQDHRIAFGSGGFSIRTAQFLREGPINIELNFKADQYILSGQGVVRWVSPQEGQAGVELTYVAEKSLLRIVQLAERSSSFIPRSTEGINQKQAGASQLQVDEMTRPKAFSTYG